MKTLECQDALIEGGCGAPARHDGVIEPLTEELRDRIEELQTRNAFLEKQVGGEISECLEEFGVEAQNLESLKDPFDQKFKDAAWGFFLADESLRTPHRIWSCLRRGIRSCAENCRGRPSES